MVRPVSYYSASLGNDLWGEQDDNEEKQEMQTWLFYTSFSATDLGDENTSQYEKLPSTTPYIMQVTELMSKTMSTSRSILLSASL